MIILQAVFAASIALTTWPLALKSRKDLQREWARGEGEMAVHYAGRITLYAAAPLIPFLL